MAPDHRLTLTRLHIPQLFDVRAGEARVALFGFAALLLLIITAHTVLETARDTLLLTGPGPRALGIVYIAIAGCTLPTAALAARAGIRFGARSALVVTLAIAAAAAAAMFVVPTSRASAIAVYIVSGVIASVVVPQFWTLVGTVLTLAQGRRLFGLIAAAGVLGGVIGSGTAALLIQVLPAKGLLLFSSAVFATAGVGLARARIHGQPAHKRAPPRTVATDSLRAFRENPFLLRVALIVFLSTATLLTLDYFFKSTLTRALPSHEIGPFVARYYLALNLLSLLIQLFVGSALVRAVGVAAAIVVTPFLLFIGATWALLAGGSLVIVLLLKGMDGSLRHSIHRITGELVYLPLPRTARERVKPLIDGALMRTAQTLTGAALLALGGTWVVAPRPLAFLVSALAFAWLIAAMSCRRPYLDLLRHAIGSGSLDAQDSPDPIDLDTAQLLVQHLASEDPLEVVGSMKALSRRGRQGFVPALVLLHQDETVLVEALGLFGVSGRNDWIRPAQRLLDDPREAVRMAAARALAMHDDLDPTQLALDAGPRVHGYAVLRLALRAGSGDLLDQPDIANIMRDPSALGQAGRLGLLAAVADAAPTKRLTRLLLALGDQSGSSPERTELFARAAGRQGDEQLIPRLVSLLPERTGREAVRSALVALREPAFTAVSEALSDTARARRLRIHVPKTLARFGTRRAAEQLLRNIETESDGLVRYKSIRALGVLVETRNLTVDRERAEALCRVDLIEHFRVLALRVALDPPHRGAPPRSAAERLLVGLLRDKLRQSLERAFRLLKIAYPNEAIHRAYVACVSGDAYARATAGEFLDALLARRGQQPLRALLRLVADDLPDAERSSRAASFVPSAEAGSREDAVAALVADSDSTVAALAGIVALEIGTPPLRQAVDDARRKRPDLEVSAGRFLRELPSSEVADG